MPEISFTLNGQARSVTSDAATAADLIRDDLDLTGTKVWCGMGACGSCTVRVDGRATLGCTTAAGDLDGREVTTIEGLGDDLHPVQRAFLAHDALQCGYCTPGFVMAAVAFYDTWRSDHGTDRPSRGHVVDALAGNLCRCGSYGSIIAAVQDACAGSFDRSDSARPARVDGYDKVTGRAHYTADLKIDGMLEAVIVRSIQPHADLGTVDPTPALAIDGVRGFAEMLGKDRRVRYFGQPIGVVVATDRATARRAADAVVVDYSPLPAAVGIDAARADGAPDAHGRGWRPPPNNEAMPVPAPRKGNVRGPNGAFSKRRYTARRRIEEARRSGDPLLIEGTWRTPGQVHAAPEPHVAIARWEGDALTVWASTQSVVSLARKVAKRFDLDKDRVTVIAQHVGGGFGSKQSLTDEVIAAVEASRAAGAPVRVLYDQSEVLSVAGHRPGNIIDLSLLVASDGEMRALSVTSYADGGASAGQTAAGLLRLTYPGAPMSLLDYDVISNAPPGKPFRAPGAPQATFALETAIDRVALRLGDDPVALRRRWSTRPLRQALYVRVASHPLWRDRTEPGEGRIRRGVGVAFGTWYYGYDPKTVVRVANESGRLVVATGTQDMGQGSRTVLATAVAGVFGLDPTEIDVRLGDSSLGHGPTSSASRTSTSVFPTADHAALDLRGKLVEAAAAELDMEGAAPVEGGLSHAGEFVPWGDVLARLPDIDATSDRPKDTHFTVTPIAVEGVQVGWGLSDAAYIVEVEVDTQEATIRPTRAWAGIAAGRIYTPAQARSQVEGALIQGIGLALTEARRLDPVSGRTLTTDLGSYRIPTIDLAPELEIDFLEEGFEHAPGGGSGIAELAIVPVPAAVANAVAHAVGRPVNELPVPPELLKQ